MTRTSAAKSLIGRILHGRDRVHVQVANDNANRVQARAICSCQKLHAPHRRELDPDRAVQQASDDAFHHSCTTGHLMATPLVRVTSIADTGWRTVA